MKTALVTVVTVGVVLMMLPGLAAGSGTGTLDVKRGVMKDVGQPLMSSGADCVMGSYYMLDGCGFATVVEGIGEVFCMEELPQRFPEIVGSGNSRVISSASFGLNRR